MKKQWQKLLLCLFIPLLVGIVAGLLTQSSMETFSQLNQPKLSPPGFLFPVVWTVLYLLMGLASYSVLTADAPKSQIAAAFRIYGLQLAFNFLWSFLFFTFEQYCLAFFWLVFLWLLILLTIKRFQTISNQAAVLFIPYLAWVTFAGYLNFSICLLN